MISHIEALEEFSDYIYHPSMKFTVSVEAIAMAIVALNKEIENDMQKKVEPWTVCFCCHNKTSPLCKKCTRNSFAPSGEGKQDYYNFTKEHKDDV